MDYAAFDAIMREGIIVRWIVPAALVAATLVGVVWYIISKLRNGIASDRSLGFMLSAAVLSMVFVIIAASDVLPMMRDLNSQNYASVYGIYKCEQNSQSRRVQLVQTVTLDDGEVLEFRRAKPIGWKLNGAPLPEGEHMATVWYAVESNCIVDIVLDEPIPEE